MVGTVTLSLEVELGWGAHDSADESRYDALSENREVESETLNALLRGCREHDVPISFDVVGHLLADSCDGVHAEAPHAAEWFNEDPGSDSSEDPLFYAPDAIDWITSSSVSHEICTHTFSHVICNDISSAVFNWEMEMVRSIHRSSNLPTPTSLVPPRGRLPDSSWLRNHGIRCVRVPYLGHLTPFNKRNYVKSVLSHPVTEPTVKDGLVSTHCTPLPSLTSPFLPDGQREAALPFRGFPTSLRKHFHRYYLAKALDKVIEEDGYVHLWSHLYNMSNKHQIEGVLWFLKRLGEARDQGAIEILTMGNLADRHL